MQPIDLYRFGKLLCSKRQTTIFSSIVWTHCWILYAKDGVKNMNISTFLSRSKKAMARIAYVCGTGWYVMAITGVDNIHNMSESIMCSVLYNITHTLWYILGPIPLLSTSVLPSLTFWSDHKTWISRCFHLAGWVHWIPLGWDHLSLSGWVQLKISSHWCCSTPLQGSRCGRWKWIFI